MAAQDPLNQGRVQVTLEGYVQCLKLVRDKCSSEQVPILVTGGGGYHEDFTPLAWAHLIAAFTRKDEDPEVRRRLQEAQAAAEGTPCTLHKGIGIVLAPRPAKQSAQCSMGHQMVCPS